VLCSFCGEGDTTNGYLAAVLLAVDIDTGREELAIGRRRTGERELADPMSAVGLDSDPKALYPEVKPPGDVGAVARKRRGDRYESLEIDLIPCRDQSTGEGVWCKPESDVAEHFLAVVADVDVRGGLEVTGEIGRQFGYRLLIGEEPFVQCTDTVPDQHDLDRFFFNRWWPSAAGGGTFR